MDIAQDILERIEELTSPHLAQTRTRLAMRDFASASGWRPSDEMCVYPGTEHIANGHLLVEHGLEHSAVITFLKTPKHTPNRFDDLTEDDKYKILGISFNNLVDWHFFPDTSGIAVVNNRVEPPRADYTSIVQQRDAWRVQAFNAITERSPHPNLKSLDDALIDVLRQWKLWLAAELGNKATNSNISALFNAILLVRALEDHERQRRPNDESLLLQALCENKKGATTRECIDHCFKVLPAPRPGKDLLDDKALRVFDALDEETKRRLFHDFYRYHLYRYDFSIISKHALSRIYEHYVSLLRENQSAQMKLWSGVDLPQEITNRDLGSYYTPQYVARFFARYLQDTLPPNVFRSLKVVDPCCGSGIFLRTILEMQCDPLQAVDMNGPTKDAFANLLGIDVDENARQATRLSLALLYLTLTDNFPAHLNILNVDAIDYYTRKREELSGTYDVAITNPPFIPWQKLPSNLQSQLREFLADSAHGKLDMFLGLLKIGLEIIRPGGLVLYVLPHSFLIARNSRGLRELIGKEFWVRLVADLSQIRVFDAAGAYVILLVGQRKPVGFTAGPNIEPKARVVRCSDFPAQALQKALEGEVTETESYSIFDVDQSFFRRDEWDLLPPDQEKVLGQLSLLPTLEHFLFIRSGFITGADKVFLRSEADVPRHEHRVYRPYLPDREMRRYQVPQQTSEVVFYPYLGNTKITEEQLETTFPITWKYLSAHRKELEERKPVIKGEVPWWFPNRPREPERMMRPKIVAPHLVLIPRFCLDADGRYAVSHSPILYPKPELEGLPEILTYFTAVLNSSCAQWQMSRLSHKYREGYTLLEVGTLKRIRVPDPLKLPRTTLKKLNEKIARLINNPDDGSQDEELDRSIMELYHIPDSLERVIKG